MDFRLGEDQRALQQGARDFCRSEITSEVVRGAFDGPDGDAPELYKKMAELGWLGLTVPEEHGGLGMGTIEQAVVCEELGYVNAPGAFFSTGCLAIPALVALGADDLLEPLVEGSKRATVAEDGDLVCDGGIADGVVFVGDGRATWFEREELDVETHETVDGTRRFAEVVPKTGGRDLGPADTLDPVIDAATAALCAEMVGGMQWALDTTVEYAKEREQFGRPVGSFQAVKHRLADMMVRTESSRSAAYYAAYANANGEPDAAYASSVAKAYCSDAGFFVTGEAIQLHGGIGFTWEHDAHLYFKRAVTNQVLLGDAAYHHERALRLDPQVPGA